MVDNIEKLSKIATSDRILLLPHCLRKSNSCKAKYDSSGLQCVKCNPDCSVNKLRSEALKRGYKGVCVAPGGRLAVKFVKENNPKAVVAVACDKELEEGLQGVENLAKEDIRPVMVIVPLLKDGCVDTVVNDEEALRIIDTGCVPVEI
jgi:uncharacterized protein